MDGAIFVLWSSFFEWLEQWLFERGRDVFVFVERRRAVVRVLEVGLVLSWVHLSDHAKILDR